MTTHRRGIPHIEDLPITRFLEIVENLSDYHVSEKVDGSNLHFGIDENGFYTSREKFGGKRIYNHNDYPVKFSTSYMRSAHKALEQILPSLKQHGFTEGSEIEAEVLYGPLPNVVPYNTEHNKIVFLRSFDENLCIHNLASKLNERISVYSENPYTVDGRDIHILEQTDVWLFKSVPKDHAGRALAGPFDLSDAIEALKSKLSEESKVAPFTVSDLVTMPLNKKPQVDFDGTWLEVKEEAKTAREQIAEHVMEVKRTLLGHIVDFRQSYFGDDDSWVEGVVFEHKETGEMAKLIDKDRFTEVKNHAWSVRESLSKMPASHTSEDISFIGKVLTGLAMSVGHPQLGTTQAKRYLSKYGTTLQECVLSLNEGHNFDEVKEYCETFLSQCVTELDGMLSAYLKERKNLGYCKNVHNRTLSVFAETYSKVNELTEKVKSATAVSDIIITLIGNKYEN